MPYLPFQCLIKLSEIDLKDSRKNTTLYQSLRELITILFAVVFGVGLAELKTVKDGYDLFVLIVAYVSVLLSWWGYHMGTIRGPRETNFLSYTIDCFLLVTYWFLINQRSPIGTILFCYLAMFLLYFLWEYVRFVYKYSCSESHKIIRNALIANGLFAFFFFGIYNFASLLQEKFGKWAIMTTIFMLVVGYRIVAQRIYRNRIGSKKKLNNENNRANKQINVEELVEAAKNVSKNALTNITGFEVGAAIIDQEGNIFQGCNVEYDNLSNTVHAEESAISAMISGGKRNAAAIAVYVNCDTIYFPCGMCLQSLYEIGGNNLRVIACNNAKHEEKTIMDLLPYGFKINEA